MPPCSSFIIPRPLVNEGRRHEKKSTSHRCTVIREAFHCVRRSNTCSPMTDLSDEMTHFLLEDWLRVLYLAAHKRPPFYIVIQYCRQSGMDIMEKLLPDFLKGRSFQRLSPCCQPPIHAQARHRLADSALSDPLQGRHGRLRHHKDFCFSSKTTMSFDSHSFTIFVYWFLISFQLRSPPFKIQIVLKRPFFAKHDCYFGFINYSCSSHRTRRGHKIDL